MKNINNIDKLNYYGNALLGLLSEIEIESCSEHQKSNIKAIYELLDLIKNNKSNNEK